MKPLARVTPTSAAGGLRVATRVGKGPGIRGFVPDPDGDVSMAGEEDSSGSELLMEDAPSMSSRLFGPENDGEELEFPEDM